MPKYELKWEDVCYSCRFFQKINNGDMDRITGYCILMHDYKTKFGTDLKCENHISWNQCRICKEIVNNKGRINSEGICWKCNLRKKGWNID